MINKIAYFSPDDGDACSFYRGIGVLGELFRHDISIMRCPPRISWPDFSDCSVAFMQRPFNDLHVQVAKMLKHQMPLWIDYDDDLTAVPDTNPSYTLYNDQKVVDNIGLLLGMADTATVSTRTLAEKFVGSIVVPNAYNNYRLPTEVAFPKSRDNRTILWRGTESHQGDLLAFSAEIDELIANFPNDDFVFFGFYPWMLKNRDNPNVNYFRKRDIYQYFQILDKIRPDLVIVPLEDNLLNRAKSNIAHLETARYGAITVAPDWEEWQIPGVVNYNSSQSFYDFVKNLLDSKREKTNSSWRHVQFERFLSDVNEARVEIYRSLVQ